MMNSISKSLKILRQILREISIAAMVVLITMLFIERIVRKFIGNSVFTVQECGGMGMYLFVVLSISYLYEINAHLSCDFVVNMLPENLREKTRILNHFLTIIFAAFCFYIWYRFLFTSSLKLGKSYRMTGILEWPFHLLALISWGVLVLTALEKFISGIGIKREINPN